MGFPLTVDSRGTFYLDEIGASKNFHTRRSNYWRKGGFHEPLATQRKPNVSSELEILAILRVRNQNPSRDRLNSTRKLERIWNFTEKKIEHIFSIGWIKFSPIGRGDANFFNPPVEGAWSSSSCTRSIHAPLLVCFSTLSTHEDPVLETPVQLETLALENSPSWRKPAAADFQLEKRRSSIF